MSEKITKYGKIILLNIEAEKPYLWNIQDATHLRIVMPSTPENLIEMQLHEYFVADKIIDTSVNLLRNKIDYNSFVRMQVSQSKEHKDEILEIALASFQEDRRFNITPKCDYGIAEIIIKEWIEQQEEYFICKHKNQVIGFLSLINQNGNEGFVNLAAVDFNYRISGAAVSLYAYVADYCINNRYKKLNGCISSNNIAVMNLYSLLGATFSRPRDVFLKEVVS
jgi:hypothetical protein